MKIKKVILGSLVFVFAVGSVIASNFFATQAYVKADTNQGLDQCEQLDVVCNDAVTDQFECKVEVQTISGPQTGQAFDVGCIRALTHNTSDPILDAQPTDPNVEIIEVLE